MKKYRVYFHYYRQGKCMSIHWRGKCFTVSYIDCQIPVETKWNKRQPNLVLQGFATAVTITDDTATII